MTGISLCQKIFFSEEIALPLKRTSWSRKSTKDCLAVSSWAESPLPQRSVLQPPREKNLLPIKRVQLIKKWFGISRDQLSRLPTTGLLQSPLCDPPASHTFTSPCRPLLLQGPAKFFTFTFFNLQNCSFSLFTPTSDTFTSQLFLC